MMDSTRGQIDFLIVGAEKGGTTWLARMLRQHPQVYLPPQKELYYFNRRFVEDPRLKNQHFDQPVSWYLAFFAAAHPGQKKGEACPAYLWDEDAPGRIYAFDPQIQIFMVLREPVERTLSAYRFYRQRGVIRCSLAEAVKKHRDLLVERSAYAEQVARYLAFFPREQMHVYLYDALRQDPVAFLKAFERDLGVDAFVPEDVLTRANVTGEPKYLWLNQTLFRVRALARKYLPMSALQVLRRAGLAQAYEALRKANKRTTRATHVQTLDPQLRQALKAYFEPDILRLQTLLDMDLSAWLT
ncbi:MAG: sulfotransferase [Chloroflexi bacterium]|nr:sulfotransferase [Chloroflexota bacterium]